MSTPRTPCDHDYQYYAATNEDGWRCTCCSHRPGEPAGFSPQLDRERIHFKVESLLMTLHHSELVYVSNGDHGEFLTSAVVARCRKEARFDQYSVALFALDEMAESHAKYWAKVSDAIIAGKDQRDRCHCGKLATCWCGAERFCSDHWSERL